MLSINAQSSVIDTEGEISEEVEYILVIMYLGQVIELKIKIVKTK